LKSQEEADPLSEFHKIITKRLDSFREKREEGFNLHEFLQLKEENQKTQSKLSGLKKEHSRIAK
jgi:hypothetical protein